MVTPLVYTAYRNAIGRICLKFRGSRIDRRCRVLKNGALVEILAWARKRHGEEIAQQLIDDAVMLQQDRNAA